MKFFRWLLAVSILVPFAGAQSDAPQTSAQKPLTIEAIFAEGGITGRAPENIQWSPDSARLSYIQRDDSGENGELWSMDVATGEKKLVVSEGKLSSLAPPASQIRSEREKERIFRYHVAAYLWAPDSNRLLFDAQGQLWLYTIANGTATQFTSDPEPSVDPKFSPDGARVSYVRGHNLYVRPVSGKDEKQLTRDKNENVLNGEVDWVYAEELSVRSNYFWSPDSKNIVFLQMNESRVPTYPLVDWLPTHPKVDLEKYPKAGDPNPSVRLGVVGSNGGGVKWISLSPDNDIYIPRFGWVRDGVLWAEVLNRAQDEMDLYFIDARSGRSRKVLTESAPDAWVNVNDDFRLLKSGDGFVWSSWRDGHSHLYLYRIDPRDPLATDARLERQLTQGNFEVLQVDALDDSAVYFSSNKDDAHQHQLYSVKLDGTGMHRVSQAGGSHAVTFAPDSKHYVDDFSSRMTPPGLAVCASAGPCQAVWQSRSVSDYRLSQPQSLELKADDGTRLYGELLLPAQAASASKVPLIVYVYGGPAAQLARDEWMGTRGLFHQLLSREGFAIFTVDNRGTPGRDRKFQTAIRKQFGGVELNDQLTALEQLLAQYSQLDRSRMAIWGWSNGGSMTLYALTHSQVFKAGVSVAPVTDWHDYDSIYTKHLHGIAAGQFSRLRKRLHAQSGRLPSWRLAARARHRRRQRALPEQHADD